RESNFFYCCCFGQKLHSLTPPLAPGSESHVTTRREQTDTLRAPLSIMAPASSDSAPDHRSRPRRSPGSLARCSPCSRGRSSHSALQSLAVVRKSPATSGNCALALDSRSRCPQAPLRLASRASRLRFQGLSQRSSRRPLC